MGFLQRLAGAFGYSTEHRAIASDGYDGGNLGRRQLSTFTPIGSSPDGAHLPQARTIRARSRQLARDNSLALGAINTTVTSVVGTGIEAHSRIDREALGLTEDQATSWQAEAERIFRGWGEYEADIARGSTFYELQSVAFRSVLEGGDCFAVLASSPRKDALLNLRVQLIEAELCSNPSDKRDTDSLIAGVELDVNRAPVAYHFANQYPGNNRVVKPKKWTRVPAFGSRTGRRNVLHLMRVLRPNQTRGISFLAPVIEPLKQLKDYTEAEITAAVVSGMFSIFIKTPTGETFDPLKQQTGASSRDDDAIELAPGLVASLASGEEPVAFNPGRPNTAFDPFVQAILRQIGVALEIPFEILVKHFTASYSAARAALIEAWRFFKVRREWLVSVFCQPCYEAVIDEAVAHGFLAAPGYFDDIRIRRAYLGTEWTGDGMGQLNPLDEINAAKEAVSLGVSNRAIVASEMNGRDWHATHAQLAREEKIRLADGLAPDPSLQGAKVPPAPAKSKADETQGGPKQ